VHPDGQIEAFFDSFATASDALDVDRLAELFAETFLAADPASARPVPGRRSCRPCRVGPSCSPPLASPASLRVSVMFGVPGR
jgi:hypothetical protein